MLKDGWTYLLSRAIPGISTVLSIAIFTRALGPEKYGQYTLLIVAAGVIGAVLFNWLPISISRFLPEARTRAEASSVVGGAYMAFLALSAATVLLAVLGLSVVRGVSATTLIMPAVLAVSQVWFDLSLRIANARGNPRQYAILAGIKSVAFLGLGSVAVILGGGVVALVLALVASQAIVPVAVQTREIRSAGRAGARAHLARALRYGAPLSATLLLILLINASDRYFLAIFLGSRQVGLYAAPYDLAQYALGILASVVNLAAFPKAISAFARLGITAGNREIQKAGRFLIALTLPATVGVMVLSGNIVGSILGPQYSVASGSVMGMIAVAIFLGNVKSFYFDYPFHIHGSMGRHFLTVATGATANVLLNLALIPTWGMRGAAASTIVAFAVSLAASAVSGRKLHTLPNFLDGQTLRIGLATLFMATCLLAVNESRGVVALGVQVLVGLLSYGTGALLLDVVGLRESALTLFGRAWRGVRFVRLWRRHRE